MFSNHSFLDGSRRHDRLRKRGISEGLYPPPSTKYDLSKALSLVVPGAPTIVIDPAIEVQISYDGNGNTGGSPPTDSNWYTVGEDSTVVASAGSLVRENVGSPPVSYTFSCWNTAADGSGIDYDPSDEYAFMEEEMVVLYAKWVAV